MAPEKEENGRQEHEEGQRRSRKTQTLPLFLMLQAGILIFQQFALCLQDGLTIRTIAEHIFLSPCLDEPGGLDLQRIVNKERVCFSRIRITNAVFKGPGGSASGGQFLKKRCLKISIVKWLHTFLCLRKGEDGFQIFPIAMLPGTYLEARLCMILRQTLLTRFAGKQRHDGGHT